MKLELTNPKAWNKISERNIPMESKLKVYEKVGGAYRLGKSGGEQVYNTLSELVKDALKEGWPKNFKTKDPPSYHKTTKSVDVKSPTYKEDFSKTWDVDEPDPIPIGEGDEDHEVGMAINLLDDIIRNATELKGKIGSEEFNMPGWIQDHISQSQNFINQANTGYHELKTK